MESGRATAQGHLAPVLLDKIRPRRLPNGKEEAAENVDAAFTFTEKAQGSPLCKRQSRPGRQGDEAGRKRAEAEVHQAATEEAAVQLY